MSIECVICYENLQSSEAVYHTPCGHVFHQTCLAKWFERSKTCPECRQKVAESKIGRIYLHYASNDSVTDAVSSLQSAIAGLNHELLIKEIEIIESNSNNTKLSTLLKSKDCEVKRLEADIWIAREHHRLWKNHAQMQMTAHECTRKEVSRLTKELEELKSAHNLAYESWNKVMSMFRGENDPDTIIKMIADSQSELMSSTTSRCQLERTVATLEEELEADTEARVSSVGTTSTTKDQLEQDLACSAIVNLALRQRIQELEGKIIQANTDDDDVDVDDDDLEITDDSDLEKIFSQPIKKKRKIGRRPLDVIDLTEEPVQIVVDLSEDDEIIAS